MQPVPEAECRAEGHKALLLDPPAAPCPRWLGWPLGVSSS